MSTTVLSNKTSLQTISNISKTVLSKYDAAKQHNSFFFFSQITDLHHQCIFILFVQIACYLMSPSEEARRVDVWMRFIFIVRHLDVIPDAVVYPGHDAWRKRHKQR